jgi:hypothetical protein
MDQFYMIVMGAIGVLLIIMLTAVGLLMYSAKSTPDTPIRSTCPDYWEFDGVGCKFGIDDNGVNKGELTMTKINTDTPDYKDAGVDAAKIYYRTSAADQTYFLNPAATRWTGVKYKGLSEVCSKGKWATDLGIVWDGYTNTTEC